MRNNGIKKLNYLYNNITEKEKIEIIKNNYVYKRIFCHLCQEYTYVNKFYKSSDDIDCKILVKYYCSESHKDHCSTLLDFLFQCCKNEIYEGNVTKYIRDGKQMKLTNDELNSIKNEYNNMQDKIPKKNKLLKGKIIKIISDINNLTDLQKKLYQKFEKSFNNNAFFNELIFYFIKMIINTYEQVFTNYPSHAIIYTLKNFIEYTDNYDNNHLEIDLKNDITKDLLTGINYFKKNYIIKIFEPEIDINKIKNKSNITISNDDIFSLRYLNKYKTLLVGSSDGKIYCFNIEKNKCFCKIQAHNEDEEQTEFCGIWYICEIDGNRLITCSKDYTMKLWEIIDKSNEKKNSNIDIKYITVIRGHRNTVRKVIQLKNNKNINNKIKLASCSFDYCIGFWEEKSKNKFELIKMVQSHNFWINEIHEIYDGRIFVIGGEYDPVLKIWNPNNYTFEIVKEKIFCVNHDCIIEINKDYYIIGGNHTYLLMFRLSRKMIERVIYIGNMYINSLILLNDGNLLADSGRNMIKYVYLGNYEVKDAINTNVTINWYIHPLGNRMFATSDRECIKIWEY